MKLTSQRVATLLGTSLIAACSGTGEEPVSSAPTDQHYAPLTKGEESTLIPGQYIITFDAKARGATAAFAEQIARSGRGNRVLHTYSVIPALAARLTDEQLDVLRRDPAVVAVEQDQRVALETAYLSQADGLDRIDQTTGHDAFYDDHFRTGAGVHIYVVDTGIYAGHSEFTGRVSNGYDFVDNDANPDDCHGHGTHVSSTAAGTKYGVAKQATLHGVRVLDCGGFGSWAGVIAGVDFVANDCPNQSGRCVANMSLGGFANQAVKNAVAAAIATGVPFAVAAGNNADNACSYSPANTSQAITVGAIDDGDQRAWFSNWGPCVDLFAPGVSIRGAYIGNPNAFVIWDGTSMASPHVAGVIAQYLQDHPGAIPVVVEFGVESAAHRNCVADEAGSPDLLLYNDFDAADANGPFDCSIAIAPDTCNGFCGGMADAGCYCDDRCVITGDCCPDYQDICTP